MHFGFIPSYLFLRMELLVLMYGFFFFQMALDAKAIKEEIPDKDIYDSSARRTKGEYLYTLFKLPVGNTIVYEIKL